jgi:hypothetical protein
LEEAVASGLPAAVIALNNSGALAIDGDGPHNFDRPRVNQALDLNDLMASTAYEHVEEGFDDVRDQRLGVGPVAEGAGAVTGEVIANQGHAGCRLRVPRSGSEAGLEDVCGATPKHLLAIRESSSLGIVGRRAEIRSAGEHRVERCGIRCADAELPRTRVDGTGGSA